MLGFDLQYTSGGSYLCVVAPSVDLPGILERRAGNVFGGVHVLGHGAKSVNLQVDVDGHNYTPDY